MRERPAGIRQAEAPGASSSLSMKKAHEVPVSTANLQHIEEAAKSGLGRRTSLPSRARAHARADGAAASRGRKASPTSKLTQAKDASAPVEVGKNLLGLDFALLAQRAAPSSKNRLEQILQQLSDEISQDCISA